ncbi:MAG: SLBB domain-containing protein [Gemmatimonadaceae bacterium]
MSLACAALSASAFAQQTQPRPTPQQARAALARPELVLAIRQQLQNSGLTRDQLRARLRAEGYPEDLVDAYLPGGTGTSEAPSSDLFNALRELGIADSTDIAFLEAIQSDSTTQTARDSLIRARDSLSRRDTLSRLRDRVVVRTDVADSLVKLDSGFNIYGLDIFRSNTTRFDPNMLGPVDANYRLGPGDRLVLILSGDVEAAHELPVTREGFIVIPQVGQLHVANLTKGQLEDLLFARLGRVYSGVRRNNATTFFSVSVARLRSNQIFVLGEVTSAGSKVVSSAGTAFTALFAAGGPTANGSMRNIQVRRAGVTVGALDLYDYLLRGDASHDVRLESGDVLYVPTRERRIRIVGEVVRPATYELKQNETLADLIAFAGGFKADASRRRVQIERVLPPSQRSEGGRERVTIEVDSPHLANGEPPLSRLEAGDVVRVFPVAERVRNTISVRGNVWSPGQQGLMPGMKISDALKLAGGPKPDVYLGSVLVTRLLPDSSRVQLRAALRDSTGTVANDFLLMEDDVIEVFALTEFRPERYVFIGGEVRKPQRVPYRQGMTVRDLILLAGGLKEGAYLKEANVARLPEDRTGNTTALTIRVPLDSTYLFERKEGEPYLGAPGLQAAARGAPDFELKPYDNVLIMQQPNWELQRVVRVSGEVQFPSQYALINRNERVADIIERAGGLTSEAYPEGSVFIRSRGNVGRVAIDVPRALKNKNSPENLLLMDGDQITIPVRSNIVTIRGAVNAPNVVAYVKGRDIDYYIDQAGGSARNADYRRAFITQPNGKRETKSFANRSPKPLPGSLVVVPELDPAQKTSLMEVMAVVAPVLASLATLIIAIGQ